MTDNAKPVGAEPETNTDSPAAVVPQEKANEPFKAYATKDDFEAHKQKMTEAERRRADKAEAELAKIREANESETEKERRKAVKEATDAIERERAVERRNAEVKLHLVARGVDPQRAEKLMRFAPEDFETAEDAVKAIEAEWPDLLKPRTKSFDAGTGREAESPNGEKWTDEAVNAAIANGTYAKHREEILRSRSRNKVTASVSVRKPT